MGLLDILNKVRPQLIRGEPKAAEKIQQAMTKVGSLPRSGDLLVTQVANKAGVSPTIARQLLSQINRPEIVQPGPTPLILPKRFMQKGAKGLKMRMMTMRL